MPLDVDKYKVSSVRELYYIPEYISEAEHKSLLREISSSRAKWTQVGSSILNPSLRIKGSKERSVKTERNCRCACSRCMCMLIQKVAALLAILPAVRLQCLGYPAIHKTKHQYVPTPGFSAKVKGRKLQYFGGQVREQTSSLIHVPLPRYASTLVHTCGSLQYNLANFCRL